MASISLPDAPLCARFFAGSNTAAVGTLSGELQLLHLDVSTGNSKSSKRKHSTTPSMPRVPVSRSATAVPVHAQPLRSLVLPHERNSESPGLAITASSDRSLIALDCASLTGVLRVANAHRTSVNVVASWPDGRTVASGDDDGVLKVCSPTLENPVNQLLLPAVPPIGRIMNM